MDRTSESKLILSWNFNGSFTAEIINGQISQLAFCEQGSGTNCEGKCLTSIDIQFLKSVHQGLEELFKEVEAEEKRLGFSYPILDVNKVEPTPTDKP